MAEPPSNAPIIRCAEDISNFFTPRLRYETKEQFVLALLGARNKLIVSPTISIGTLTASFVHPREIFTEALKYGTPPHGGFAIGLDRFVMLLANTENIKEVIAFPKTTSASDLMCECPSIVDNNQLDVLGIKVKGE